MSEQLNLFKNDNICNILICGILVLFVYHLIKPKSDRECFTVKCCSNDQIYANELAACRVGNCKKVYTNNKAQQCNETNCPSNIKPVKCCDTNHLKDKIYDNKCKANVAGCKNSKDNFWEKC